MQAYGLNSSVVCFKVKIFDIWEGNMTTRSEIYVENIYSLGISERDIKEVDIKQFLGRMINCSSWLVNGGERTSQVNYYVDFSFYSFYSW